jgi:hypothetical protein
VTRKLIAKIDFILPPVLKMNYLKYLYDEEYPEFPVKTIKKSYMVHVLRRYPPEFP